MPSPPVLRNPRFAPLPVQPGSRAARDFHATLPGYRTTPLHDLPSLAQALGVSRVWVKDESSRLELPSFKMLGASWASYRALSQALGGELRPWPELARAARDKVHTLAAATDGNHGRAVARTARLFGLKACIFVPRDTSEARITAIRAEGGEVMVVEGGYDDAVRASAQRASDGCLVISDTAWAGYEDIPGWVVEGYSTIFWEIDEALAASAAPAPTLIVVQMGVGALAAAAVSHWAPRGARVLGVEPTSAACVRASLEAGRLVSLEGPQRSIMAGLNCGTMSSVAFRPLSAGLRCAVVAEDEEARTAMRLLAVEGIVAGESGAAGLAGLLALKALGCEGCACITPGSRVVLIVTEGATDPDAYSRVVGATVRARSGR